MSHSANSPSSLALAALLPCDSQGIPMGQGLPGANLTAKKARRGRQQGRNCEGWTRCERQAYAKLLLRYLMNGLDLCESFLEHLSTLIGRTPKEIYLQHKKLQAEFKTSHKIVTHLLKHQRGRDSPRAGRNEGCLQENAQLLLARGQQVQELKKEESAYLESLGIIEDSLEQYEDRFSEDIEVFQLADSACEYEGSTDGSFDEDNGLEN